jgi:hypothetical protein
MKQALPLQSSYAALFDPAVALAAAKRAAQWDLPRHICHPLDQYQGRRANANVNADLAAFDAAVDLAPVCEDEPSEPHSTLSGIGEGVNESIAAAADDDDDDDDDL